jgi:hypothetical protein
LLVQAARKAPRSVECRLYRDGQTERSRPLHLLLTRDLEVLDAMPPGSKVPALARVECSVHAFPHPENLLDGQVANGVNGGLEPGQVSVVEELGQLVIASIQGADGLLPYIWLGHGRGLGPDGSIEGQVAADGL